MKLSEIPQSENFKVLVYGQAGSGKTCFAAGFPTPMLYFDFDGKVNSAARFYEDDKARLDAIDVRDLKATLKQDPIVEFLNIIDKELIPSQGAEFPFKTIVLDSITTFSRAVLGHIVRTNPGIKRTSSKQGVQPGLQDYGILKREFAQLIPGLLSLPCNVVMLGHVDIQKNDLTGELVRGPLMDGAFATQLPVYFEEVYHSYVDKGVYKAQTQPDYKFGALRSQIKGLPKDIELKYEALTKKY